MSPVLFFMMILIWLDDKHSPLYIAPRVGRNGKHFNMIKLRSMRPYADSSGVDSTSGNDPRITSFGRIIRKFKLDEFTQLWNVLVGDMSMVGPRPNVKRETDIYTETERNLLTVRPGITDFASIVFSDEGDILAGKEDPDLAYNQLIRPWKSRLGLLYVEKQSFFLDLALILVTVLAIVSRKKALQFIAGILKLLEAPEDLIRIAKREDELSPFPPPGMDKIVMSRE